MKRKISNFSSLMRMPFTGYVQSGMYDRCSESQYQITKDAQVSAEMGTPSLSTITSFWADTNLTIVRLPVSDCLSPRSTPSNTITCSSLRLLGGSVMFRRLQRSDWRWTFDPMIAILDIYFIVLSHFSNRNQCSNSGPMVTWLCNIRLPISTLTYRFVILFQREENLTPHTSKIKNTTETPSKR